MMRAPAADLFTPRPEPEVLTRYATDGKCHNAEPGTFNLNVFPALKDGDFCNQRATFRPDK